MGWPVNVVEAGGLPVSEAPEGYGTQIVAAPDGFGYPVTIVASGGMPVAFGEGISGGSAPDGFGFLILNGSFLQLNGSNLMLRNS